MRFEFGQRAVGNPEIIDKSLRRTTAMPFRDVCWYRNSRSLTLRRQPVSLLIGKPFRDSVDSSDEIHRRLPHAKIAKALNHSFRLHSSTLCCLPVIPLSSPSLAAPRSLFPIPSAPAESPAADGVHGHHPHGPEGGVQAGGDAEDGAQGHSEHEQLWARVEMESLWEGRVKGQRGTPSDR